MLLSFVSAFFSFFFFQLNISYPATGCQKCIEIDDERKLRSVFDLRMAQEVDGAKLGDEFAGYVFRIAGGNDKQGFPMKQVSMCDAACLSGSTPHRGVTA